MNIEGADMVQGLLAQGLAEGDALYVGGIVPAEHNGWHWVSTIGKRVIVLVRCTPIQVFIGAALGKLRRVFACAKGWM